MTKKCGYKIKRILNVGFANGSEGASKSSGFTSKNSTALLTSVTGIEENPTEIFLAEMQNIVPEMQDLPFYHKGIECFCPKFVLFEDQWIGTVLTPWMMSVVILPGPQQQLSLIHI